MSVTKRKPGRPYKNKTEIRVINHEETQASRKLGELKPKPIPSCLNKGVKVSKKKRKKKRNQPFQERSELYECADCGRKYREKSHLATHTRAHIDIRNFKCNTCGLLFKTQTNLFFHMKTHSEVPFTCDKCNKTFSERKMLKRHMRVVHR